MNEGNDCGEIRNGVSHPLPREDELLQMGAGLWRCHSTDAVDLTRIEVEPVTSNQTTAPAYTFCEQDAFRRLKLEGKLFEKFEKLSQGRQILGYYPGKK